MLGNDQFTNLDIPHFRFQLKIEVRTLFFVQSPFSSLTLNIFVRDSSFILFIFYLLVYSLFQSVAIS